MECKMQTACKQKLVFNKLKAKEQRLAQYNLIVKYQSIKFVLEFIAGSYFPQSVLNCG